MLHEQFHVAVEARKDYFELSDELFISCCNCNYMTSGSYFRPDYLHDFLQLLCRKLSELFLQIYLLFEVSQNLLGGEKSHYDGPLLIYGSVHTTSFLGVNG